MDQVELTELTKVELQMFLRERGLPTTGNKPELIRLAAEYASNPPVNQQIQLDCDKEAEKRREVFTDSRAKWQSVTDVKLTLPIKKGQQSAKMKSSAPMANPTTSIIKGIV